MSRAKRIGGLCLWLACGISGAARAEEAPFRDIPFEKAKDVAKEGGKRFVLVDFYTTWCGPCKRLDQTTWKDPGVKDWLAKEAVCLKIDAEKEEALAGKYRIDAYPTILMLRPDGTEIDRLVGYRDAKTFLVEARDSLAGFDGVARARKKLEGASANNPLLRTQYADELARKGRHEEALSEYLWCFDHGLEHGPAFAGVRVSFLLSSIVQLGKSHPPALDALRQRRDAARKALEGGKADVRSVTDFTALNRSLGEPEQTLALYDAIKDNKSAPPGIRKQLLSGSRDQLLKKKRYKELLVDTDARSAVRSSINSFRLASLLAPKDEDFRRIMRQGVIEEGTKSYEALVGTGDRAGAAEVAASLIAIDPAIAYPELIAAAGRAGDSSTAEELSRQAPKAARTAPPK